MYLNAATVLVASHTINLIHDQDVFTAHSLRRAYKASTHQQLHLLQCTLVVFRKYLTPPQKKKERI